jgi:REP element-mobilizing transposase RayT
MLIHLVAKARAPLRPFADHAVAARVWRALRRASPHALAAVLMPDHLHLILDVGDPLRARRQVGAILGALSRRFAGLEWQPVPPPVEIPDSRHLARQVRYVLLNPCRAELARDPLVWTWTTHRDVVGAVADPWVSAAALARALRRTGAEMAAELHAYVSADPSCSVVGTPLPEPAPPASVPVEPLAPILAAAAAATRGAAADVRRPGPTRRLFVQLATRQGWRSATLLGRVCGITRQAIDQIRRQVPADPRPLAAAALCLGDERLLQPFLPGAAAFLTGKIAETTTRGRKPGLLARIGCRLRNWRA